MGDDVFGRGRNTQAEYALLDSWAAKPPSIDWAVAAAAGVAGETAERGLRLLEVKAGDTLFVDGGAGGVGAVTVQMALARGARVIASASEANHVEAHDLTYKGDFPVNTGGGELSVGQAGLAGGFLHIVEALRQLRGEAEGHQVKKAERALVTGIGWLNYGRNLGTTAALVMERRK